MKPSYKSDDTVYVVIADEKHTWKGKLYKHVDKRRSRVALQALLATSYKFKKIPKSLQKISVEEVVYDQTDDVVVTEEERMPAFVHTDDVTHEESVPVSVIEESEDDTDDVLVTGQVLSREARKNHAVSPEPSLTREVYVEPVDTLASPG